MKVTSLALGFNSLLRHILIHFINVMTDKYINHQSDKVKRTRFVSQRSAENRFITSQSYLPGQKAIEAMMSRQHIHPRE